MNRIVMTALLLTAVTGLAGCGAAASAGSSSPGASASPRFGGRNGISGELVQMNGTNLVVNSQSGDVTVVYTNATTFQKTSTGTFADILAGKCLTTSGQKDASGALTATTVRLSDKVNGACRFAGPRTGAPATARPSPPAGRPNFSVVGGEVTAVSGNAVTVTASTGASQTVTVPTTVRVSKSSPATASDLALHQCITANGPKDTSGKVTARSIAIVPPGPSGCATGGRGGFGGGGVPGGGGGAGGGLVPPPGD
jgi:hypothetical protein